MKVALIVLAGIALLLSGVGLLMSIVSAANFGSGATGGALCYASLFMAVILFVGIAIVHAIDRAAEAIKAALASR